jgi:DNA polymerase III subunit alpha
MVERIMSEFTHLHVHTQYSILDGASSISGLIAKALEYGMKSIAITDHGNMFGVKAFFNEARKQGIKPIIGCEIYVAAKSRFDKTETDDRSGYHLILLAKNKTGYKNLVKLISYAWIEGFYYKPRIDRELLIKYHEGLIATTACLAGEIPQAILNKHIDRAEELVQEFKGLFGDDFYLEVQRHYTGDPYFDNEVYTQQNQVLEYYKILSEKYGVKMVATNDLHFINRDDAEAHDRLICLNTGKDLDDPNRMRYTKQEYLKTPDEMLQLFSDVPYVLDNSMEIDSKIEEYDLNQEAILPDFPLPDDFADPNEYLHFLTYKGAEKRYAEITDELKDRIDFELGVIKNMGFSGYFLIVQDFIQAARDMNVSVGPGRGSAAGSVVAYCNFITDIDPIKYDLLFERFLNPDRISMPDIDIDFDEDGRDKVIQWVINKYGKNKVAQIITFGTMAAKMAIRDVARVQKLPLAEADKLAKLVPERPGITLKQAFHDVKELADAKTSENKLISETLKYAETLEGSVRHTGLHACGVIISRDDLTDHIPICTSKDSDLLVTQYEGGQVESVGMLKMDFLGLKTLSIIRDALINIKLSKDVDISVDEIPFDDKKTFELFSQGDTGGVFQFESDGMRKHLRELKPNRFEDLIAMNALYRPGPMEYIPNYTRRKNGKEKIVYDHPIMEEYLKTTYGITVYQEQVMQLSRAMAGFTRGQADSLRKAMGKKIRKMMDELKVLFIEGCVKNDIPEKTATKVWSDWEAFAEYAFNKSHSTCYAYIAYKMAFLKAHYPAEFYAAVLSRNLSDIKSITYYIEESSRHNISVLGPDVNESEMRFTVNKNGEIRFGMAAIKGVGEAAVESIIEERHAHGAYHNIFDFAKRVSLRSVNKRSIEALAMAGAFDSFTDTHRAQYFFKERPDEPTFIEKLIKHVGILQTRSSNMQGSLFGDAQEMQVPDPIIPPCEKWTKIEQLRHENDVIGFFMSGHPLDEYRLELETFTNCQIIRLKSNLDKIKGREIIFGGMVISASHRSTKNGKPFGTFTIEDYTESIVINLFAEPYLKFRHLIEEGQFLLIRGRIDKRFNSEELEVRALSLELLSETLDKYTSEITLFLNIEELDNAKAEVLSKAIQKNKGKCPLKIKVTDQENKQVLELKSKNYRVFPTEFVKWLTELNDIQFKVN